MANNKNYTLLKMWYGINLYIGNFMFQYEASVYTVTTHLITFRKKQTLEIHHRHFCCKCLKIFRASFKIVKHLVSQCLSLAKGLNCNCELNW